MHMVIDKYFQKREHEFLYVLAPQRSEIKTGGQNLKMIFNGKSPSASFSYNHPKFRAHLSTVCAQWKYASRMCRPPWLGPAHCHSFASLTSRLRLLPSCDVG